MGGALSIWERRALAEIERAAVSGERFPTADDLLEVVGCESHSTTVWLVQNLEKKGLIQVDRYQRERRATIVSTGAQTAAVKNPATHWRDRPEHLPEPLNLIRVRDQAMFQAVLLAAKRERKSAAQFIVVLIREAMAARSIQSKPENA